MKKFFITSAGTNNGKTFVTCGLIKALIRQGRDVAAIKPIISGFKDNFEQSDTGLILRSLDLPLTDDNINAISPWRFNAPLAPNIAAKLEEREVDFEAVVQFCKEKLQKNNAEYFLIEGVGGLMSPISDDKTNLDLIRELQLEVIIVGDNYLGSISHNLMVIEILKKYQIPINTLVLGNQSASEQGLEDVTLNIENLSNVDVVSLNNNKMLESFLELIKII